MALWRRRKATRARGDRRRLVAEPLEDRRMLSVGATAPWTRYEAEAGNRGGAATLLSGSRGIGDPSGEASGRQAVSLRSTGDFVEWRVAAPANALVMRVSIPDAASGGGIDSSIAIYRNGVFLQSLPVTSRYAWLYGNDDAVTNSPASGPARKIYDESRTLLNTSLVAGDTIRVQKDEANSAAFYNVDLVELEQVAAVARPANSISITDKGAVANDGGDDTAAIVAAIADAKTQGKTVWIPAGQFRQSSTIAVAGVTVQGAGMWFSEVWGFKSGLAGAAGDNAVGFNVNGGGTKLSDFRIVGERTIRRPLGNALGGVFGTGSEFRNLWIEHTECGAWVGMDYSNNPATNLLFSGLRIRNTYADGINLCNGTVGSTIVECTARGTGDDSFAMWSVASSVRANSGNVIRNCTSECTWKAAGLAVYGGSGGLLENNLVADTLTYSGITIAASFNALPFAGTTTIRNNTLLRCGGVAWNQKHGAIWVFCDDRSIAAAIDVSGNRIIDATYSAFEINASARGNRIVGPVTFSGNVIDGAESLLWVASNAIGTATWQNTVASRVTRGTAVQNDSAGKFVPVGIESPTPTPTPTPTPVFSGGLDIGAVGRVGSDSFDAAQQTHRVSGSGADIWNAADSFRYVSRSVQGDLTLVARVDSQTSTDPWAKAGVMIRGSTAANAPFVDLVLTPGNGVSLQWRTASGANAGGFQVGGVTGPVWLKLTRSGNRFAGFTSLDGVVWRQVGYAVNVTMDMAASAGLAVTAHNNSLLSTAVFSRVSLAQAVNLAAGRPVADSTTSSGSPAAIVDGNPGSNWTSGLAASQSIRIDLGRTMDIRRVRLDWAANRATAYLVDVSHDGITWARVAAVTNGSGGVDDLSGFLASGRFVRLTLTARNVASTGFGVNEVAIYGS